MQGSEVDDPHRTRTIALLEEAGPGTIHTPAEYIAAYQAVLTKDLLWAVNELWTAYLNQVRR